MNARIKYLLLPIALVLAIAGSLALGPGRATAQGIGIYPTQLLFSDAARGGEYFRTVGVINSGDTDTIFTLEGKGPISDWISFVDAEDRDNVVKSVTVPGKSESQTLLRVTVPQDVANGEYQGFAQVVAGGGSADAGGTSVGVGAAIDVTVNVTGDQRFEASLVDGSVGDFELGYPLRVRAAVRNSGNVRITPEITLEVLDSDSNVVIQETFGANTVVFSGETGQLNHELDVSTRDLGEGAYVAHISARAANLDLGSRESSFSILPAGTLTRQGQLRDLRMVIGPRPGELGKMDVIFANTGQIDTLAKFVGELYQGDRLVDALSTEELLVPVREQKTLELLFRVDEPGDYLIKGKVNYQGKETETRELAFTVAEEEAAQIASSSSGNGATTPGSVAGGGDATAASEGPGPALTFWESLGSTLQESPFNSPVGMMAIALGFLVLVLLVLLVRRRSSAPRW